MTNDSSCSWLHAGVEPTASPPGRHVRAPEEPVQMESWSPGPGQGPTFCISDELPDDAGARSGDPTLSSQDSAAWNSRPVQNLGENSFFLLHRYVVSRLVTFQLNLTVVYLEKNMGLYQQAPQISFFY